MRLSECPFFYAVPSLEDYRSVRVAERLALPTSDHRVAGSNPAGGEILPEPKRRFIAQSLSCSSFHRLKMTEILLKGRKTLTHPSILRIMGCTLTHISLASHFWDLGKQCRPRSDAADAASDQGLHCLLTGISIRNRIKMRKYTRHP